MHLYVQWPRPQAIPVVCREAVNQAALLVPLFKATFKGVCVWKQPKQNYLDYGLLDGKQVLKINPSRKHSLLNKQTSNHCFENPMVHTRKVN